MFDWLAGLIVANGTRKPMRVTKADVQRLAQNPDIARQLRQQGIELDVHPHPTPTPQTPSLEERTPRYVIPTTPDADYRWRVGGLGVLIVLALIVQSRRPCRRHSVLRT